MGLGLGPGLGFGAGKGLGRGFGTSTVSFSRGMLEDVILARSVLRSVILSMVARMLVLPRYRTEVMRLTRQVCRIAGPYIFASNW